MNEYRPSQIVWSIYDFDGNETASTTLADGEYTVMQLNPTGHERWYRSTQTVAVNNGDIDIRASQEVIADFLNKSGDWHFFIEAAWEGPEPNTITFTLGS